MNSITDYEISQLPPPPQEWIDEMDAELIETTFGKITIKQLIADSLEELDRSFWNVVGEGNVDSNEYEFFVNNYISDIDAIDDTFLDEERQTKLFRMVCNMFIEINKKAEEEKAEKAKKKKQDKQDKIDLRNYYYSKFINKMGYQRQLDLIKKHLNINLPYKRHPKIIRDIIECYLNNYQGYHCIYRKGTRLQHFAGWDDVPDQSNPMELKTKKELRTFFKNDMIKLYSNDGEKEIKLSNSFDWKERFEMGSLEYELETEKDIEMWSKFKKGLIKIF